MVPVLVSPSPLVPDGSGDFGVPGWFPCVVLQVLVWAPVWVPT